MGHQPSLGGITRQKEAYRVDNRWWNAIYEKEISRESFTPASRKCSHLQFEFQKLCMTSIWWGMQGWRVNRDCESLGIPFRGGHVPVSDRLMDRKKPQSHSEFHTLVYSDTHKGVGFHWQSFLNLKQNSKSYPKTNKWFAQIWYQLFLYQAQKSYKQTWPYLSPMCWLGRNPHKTKQINKKTPKPST